MTQTVNQLSGAWAGDSAMPRLSSKSVEWYTPARYVEAARALMGAIDLDPASCEVANRVVRAARYYDKYSNGFDKPWPRRVWLNPPYGRGDKNSSNQERWSSRLVAQYEAGITQEAVLLVNGNFETQWFQRLWRYPICFVNHRINFSTPNGKDACSGATHGCVFVYFGLQPERFASIFREFGHVVPAMAAVSIHHLWTEGTNAI